MFIFSTTDIGNRTEIITVCSTRRGLSNVGGHLFFKLTRSK